MSYEATATIQKLVSITGNTTFVVPAGYSITQMMIQNTTANAVTGGIKVGTTSGGTDVILNQPVGANALIIVPLASISKSIFSMSVNTTIFIQAVTSWNLANININFLLINYR